MAFVPGLGRLSVKDPQKIEQLAYFDFQTMAGLLLPNDCSSWDILFKMQHHGLPTRLLDWTENFSIALYFALKDAKGDCCVWMLNPFQLNKEENLSDELLRPDNLSNDFEEYFISRGAQFKYHSIAISPLRHDPRIFNQQAGFTLHGDLSVPLEEKHRTTLFKFTIPIEAHEGARAFLKLAGVSRNADCAGSLARKRPIRRVPALEGRANPVTGSDRNEETPRATRLTEAQIVQIGKAARQLGPHWSVDTWRWREGVLWLLLTGARVGALVHRTPANQAEGEQVLRFEPRLAGLEGVTTIYMGKSRRPAAQAGRLRGDSGAVVAQLADDAAGGLHGHLARPAPELCRRRGRPGAR